MTINRPHLIARRSFWAIFFMTNYDFDKNETSRGQKDINKHIPDYSDEQISRLKRRKEETTRNKRIFFSAILSALVGVLLMLFAGDLVESVSFLAVLKPYVILISLIPLLLSAFCIGHIIDAIVRNRAYSVEFYDTFVIIKDGVVRKTEDKQMFPKILSCHTALSVKGRIFKYGNIYVNAIGKWDIDLNDIKDPRRVRRYLENHFISGKEIRSIRQTILTN